MSLLDEDQSGEIKVTAKALLSMKALGPTLFDQDGGSRHQRTKNFGEIEARLSW